MYGNDSHIPQAADSPAHPLMIHHLVAHRGDQDGGVENTLSAFERAVQHGARFAECDIQFTRDLVPVVLHDNWLKRLCRRPDGRAIDTTLDDLSDICRNDFELLTLKQLMQWLGNQPELTLFIEIKPTIRRRKNDAVIIQLLAPLLPNALMHRIIIISKSSSILDACSEVFSCRRGWVSSGHHPPQPPISHVFIPCRDKAQIPDWQAKDVTVGAYTVNDAGQARQLLAMGADLIETDYFSRLADAPG